MKKGPQSLCDLGPWLAKALTFKRGPGFKSIGFGWSVERGAWKCRIIYGQQAYEAEDVKLTSALTKALDALLKRPL